MENFKDRKGNRYEINWSSVDVTICGFFSGTISNNHEWIYANLGYGNKIERIKNIDTGIEYYIGQEIEFTEKLLSLELQEVDGGIITGFFIDSFTSRIGAYFEGKIGKCELYRCIEKIRP